MTVDRAPSLLALRGIGADRLRSLLAAADALAEGPVPVDALAGKTVATLFFEDSTRTRTSFALAATRLGAGVVDLSGKISAVSKGETLADTARTIESMGVDAVIVRAPLAGAPGVIAREVRCPVISAGDGRHEHPTQGLLDALAIARAHGRTDGFDLSGLRVTIAGDLANSRVARSTTAALTTLGAAVTLVGPPTLAPGSLAAIGGIVTSDFDAAIADADAVMMLRVQFERLGDGPPLFTTRTYRAGFAMTGERAARLKDNAIILHPGPMNRGLEIDGDVADSDRCIAREQVRLGVPVRMAVMLDLLGASAAAGSRA